jgi:hypothetical protein
VIHSSKIAHHLWGGTPKYECDVTSGTDPGCCKTIDGGGVGCNAGVCCNSVGGPCAGDGDCCAGNVCSNNFCAIDTGQGYCTENSQCISQICGGNNACTCDLAYTDVGGAWWECCSSGTFDAFGVYECVPNNGSFDAGCAAGGSGTCDSLTQVCDPNFGTDGTCKISNTGSAYEPCDPSIPSQCGTGVAGFFLSCSSTGTCCNAIGSNCLYDADCCVYSSCSTNNGQTGSCLGTSGADCTNSDQCLHNDCTSGHCT